MPQGALNGHDVAAGGDQARCEEVAAVVKLGLRDSIRGGSLQRFRNEVFRGPDQMIHIAII